MPIRHYAESLSCCYAILAKMRALWSSGYQRPRILILRLAQFRQETAGCLVSGGRVPH
jgi:hypothetical protein